MIHIITTPDVYAVIAFSTPKSGVDIFLISRKQFVNGPTARTATRSIRDVKLIKLPDGVSCFMYGM
jgi:hypothetical protein